MTIIATLLAATLVAQSADTDKTATQTTTSSNRDGIDKILGEGSFRYRLVPGWAKLQGVKVRNGHGVAVDRQGRVHLLTDHPENNLIALDPASGTVLAQKRLDMPGAHGLSLAKDGNREVFYITCNDSGRVVKTTLEGDILLEYPWPQASGKYKSIKEYKPSCILPLPGGEVAVLDGYGKDFIHRYGPDGKLLATFGGNDQGIPHWGPHGGAVELHPSSKPELILAMSDQQNLARWSIEGRKLAEIPLPGTNPRMLKRFGACWVMATIGDQWPKDCSRPGFISFLDNDFRVLVNLGAAAPRYVDGKLQPAIADGSFRHPHDAAFGLDGALYVAQFASGDQPLLKFEKVK
jgi:hypothetical protein